MDVLILGVNIYVVELLHSILSKDLHFCMPVLSFFSSMILNLHHLLFSPSPPVPPKHMHSLIVQPLIL